MSTNESRLNDPTKNELDLPLFFGDWLKRRRKQLDLTQSELAERSCCSVFALRKIEAGERRPSKQLAEMFAISLNIPPEDQPTFIKIARGELGVDRLASLIRASQTPENNVPENLPRALTNFIGREAELGAIAQLLHDPKCSLLTIVGPGGIGKTRLAIEAVHHSSPLFPNGVWFVPLAPLNSPVLIIPAIAEAVEFKFHDPTNLQEQLLSHLRTKRALIVLDNAEHLLEGVGLLTEILSQCQHIKLLVTSRQRLNLLCEWVFEIQGLPLPPNDKVQQFDTFSAVALFLQTAKRVDAGFEIQNDERQWVLKICQIMHGMPLGIELSAAWVSLLSIEEIAREIEHNLDFVSVTMRDLPERHRSLRASLDHSWKLLTPEEKLILSRLSVFRGSFSREAAQEISAANFLILSSLRNKFLLERTDQDEYDLHEFIRQYAALKLDEHPDEGEQIKNRYALYFVQYLANGEEALQGSGQVEILDQMAKIIDDLSQAWQYAVSHYHSNFDQSQLFSVDLLHKALFSLSLFYEMRCRSLEAITLFTESAAYLSSVQGEFKVAEDALNIKSILGHVTAYLGLHYASTHQHEKALELLESAIKLLSDERSRTIKAQAMVMLAATRRIKGEFQLAAQLEEQSRDVFRETGEQWWYALVCINLASGYYSLGKLVEAEELYQEVSKLVKPGDLRLKIPLTTGFAYLLFLQNDYERAEKMLQDALPLSHQLRDAHVTANILYYLGRVSFATHRIELAESYYNQCIIIESEFGESFNLAADYLHLGNCYVARGDYKAAQELFRRAIRIGQSKNQFHMVYYALVFTARAYMVEGKAQQALEIFLLLNNCHIEYKRMQEEFEQLKADLQASLPDGKLEVALNQLVDKVSPEKAMADVLTYVQEHETR